MNQRTRTLIMVAVAVITTLLAWATRPASIVDSRFADVGSPLTPALTDPAQVASMEVIAYSDAAARHRAFKIEFDGQRWIIPSAYNYPADAVSKIAEAASVFVGPTREAVVTDRRIDHARLGLVDPTDESGDPTGRGVRVTIRDAKGQTLADLIIGHTPEGEPAGSGQRFVRLASSDRAYRTSFHTPLETALSVNLTDWIDTDLLHVDADEITRVELDASSVDETRRQRVEGERFIISRDDQTDHKSGAWRLEPALTPVDQPAADAFVAAIAGLQLVGVEAMPRKIARLLDGSELNAALDANDLIRMQRAGFFLSPDGLLIANAGNLRFRTDDGLDYTLWFGEIASGSAPHGALFTADDQPAPAETNTDTRYVFVTVAAANPDDEVAKAKAMERSRRHAAWWLLIDESSFVKLHPTLADLAPDHDKSEADPAPGQPAP